ncbi:TPA: capsid protein [Stenotrophomonas maltophilia]|nr:capsid protein [Stenotrophomonas maltophilia]
MDFESILAGLSVAAALTAIGGGLALIAVVGFSLWGGRKVAGLFGKS